jgi:hypothetical protein
MHQPLPPIKEFSARCDSAFSSPVSRRQSPLDYSMPATLSPHPRAHIYYWKCDRPAAFHGTGEHGNAASIERALPPLLAPRFDTRHVTLRPAGGQGNHLTFEADIDGRALFVHVEDGPEHDDYIEVESSVLAQVRALGVPAPRVHAVDASRAPVRG